MGEAGSPLKREIARVSKLVAIFASALGMLFFGVGTTMGLPFWDSVMFAIGICCDKTGTLTQNRMSVAQDPRSMSRA